MLALIRAFLYGLIFSLGGGWAYAQNVASAFDPVGSVGAGVAGASGSGGGGTSGTISSGTSNRAAYYSAATTISSDNGITMSGAGTISTTGAVSSTALYGGLLLVGGPVVSTSAALMNKQTGTSSINGACTESPNGIRTCIHSDSTFSYMTRNGAAATELWISAAAIGVGVATSTPQASLSVAGIISGTIVRTAGTVAGGSACIDGQQTWSAAYQTLALCRTATWIILASTSITVSNSGL